MQNSRVRKEKGISRLSNFNWRTWLSYLLIFSHQKENIEKFLTFCEAYGVKDRFSTPYLYQKQNVMSVSVSF